MKKSVLLLSAACGWIGWSMPCQAAFTYEKAVARYEQVLAQEGPTAGAASLLYNLVYLNSRSVQTPIRFQDPIAGLSSFIYAFEFSGVKIDPKVLEATLDRALSRPGVDLEEVLDTQVFWNPANGFEYDSKFRASVLSEMRRSPKIPASIAVVRAVGKVKGDAWLRTHILSRLESDLEKSKADARDELARGPKGQDYGDDEYRLITKLERVGVLRTLEAETLESFANRSAWKGLLDVLQGECAVGVFGSI